MATKAQLQAAFEQCERIRHGAASALQSRDFPAAVQRAEIALPDQHAAVTFQRRFQDVPTSATPLVDLILQYAPVFFLSRSIDAVEIWYQGGTKTERSALPNIPKQIALARNSLAHAAEVWGELSESPASMVRLNSRNKALLAFWLSAGYVAAHPQDPTFHHRASDPHRSAVAKCSSCGRERRAPIAELLEPSSCPACGRRSDFVLIRRGH